jgi:hypothetical protein
MSTQIVFATWEIQYSNAMFDPTITPTPENISAVPSIRNVTFRVFDAMSL